MENKIETLVGQFTAADGDGVGKLRQGRQTDLIISELHGRYYESNFRGNVFSTGQAPGAALSANSITLTATTTPIVGVWNPGSSRVNVVPLLAVMVITVAGNSAVAPGSFIWATSIGNNVISTGNAPLSRLTLANAGSSAKGFNLGTALTGLTNNLVAQFGANFGSLVVAQGATGTPIISPQGMEVFDGSIIVPPGGVLALLNTISTTTVSIAASLVWEEIPI